MLKGYNRTFNIHALEQLDRDIDIPKPALGVDGGEDITEKPVKLYYEAGYETPVEAPRVKTWEKVDVIGKTSNFTEKNFPMDHYLGAPI